MTDDAAKRAVSKATTLTSTAPRGCKQAAAVYRGSHYTLRLYITGMTPRSTEAIGNIRAICEKHLPGKYELQVVDIYKSPQSAAGQKIVAAPTLVKSFPLPLRRIVGDLSDRQRVLLSLDLSEH